MVMTMAVCTTKNVVRQDRTVVGIEEAALFPQSTVLCMDDTVVYQDTRVVCSMKPIGYRKKTAGSSM